MKRKSEESPKVLEMPAPPEHKLLSLTAEQVTALTQAQQVVNDTVAAAKAAVEQAEARRDALLLGILTGHGISAGRAIRITDEASPRLEVELMANGNGKG